MEIQTLKNMCSSKDCREDDIHTWKKQQDQTEQQLQQLLQQEQTQKETQLQTRKVEEQIKDLQRTLGAVYDLCSSKDCLEGDRPYYEKRKIEVKQQLQPLLQQHLHQERTLEDTREETQNRMQTYSFRVRKEAQKQAQKQMQKQARQDEDVGKARWVASPHLLDGHLIQTIAPPYPDNYLCSDLLSTPGNCYLCTEPLSNAHVISTACHCKAVVHMSCLDNLAEYGYRTRLNARGIEDQAEVDRTSMQARTCGVCRGYILGAFENQHNFTFEAYKRIASRWNRDAKLDADEFNMLKVLTHAMLHVKRSIVRDWRGSCRRNTIVSTTYALLSHCYSIMYSNSNNANATSRFILKAYEQARQAAFNSLRWHNYTSISMGVMHFNQLPGLHHCLKRQHRDEKHIFVKVNLPMVLDYLCKLIDNTVPEPSLLGNSNTDPSPFDIAKARLHHAAQGNLVEILTGEMFDYVIENVNEHRNETTGGTIHDPWHHQPGGEKKPSTTPKTSPHPGMFLSTNKDLLKQLLAHKELFEVFVDEKKIERITKLVNAMSEVC